jgi:23S rRNA pseudouridine2457 synthase
MSSAFNYYQIYKPYKMLSQFVQIPKKRTLSNLDFIFADGTNALGRLDDNSEGLLLLTNDKKVNRLLMNPENKHERVYWVQVHGEVKQNTLEQLENGVDINLDKTIYKTLPCEAKIIDTPALLPARKHPVGTHFKTTWLELKLIEGKFHQIRKMTDKVGHQTMRLIRVSIEDISLHNWLPGSVKEINKDVFYQKLHLL